MKIEKKTLINKKEFWITTAKSTKVLKPFIISHRPIFYN